MNTNSVTLLIAFIVMNALSQTVIGAPDSEKKEPTYVIAEDGLLVMYASSPLKAANMLYIHYEGVAKSADGSDLSITKGQEEELKSKIEERLSKMKLSDFKERSIKEDMKVVFEEDLKNILSLDEDPHIQVTQLIISSSNQRDKKK